MGKLGIIMLLVMVAASLFVHFFFHIWLGASFLIFFVGWPITGTIVTIDDDLKGGWSNPDGSVRPPWMQMPFWGQILCGIGLSSAGFAIDAHLTSRLAILFWACAAVCFVAAVPMIAKGFKNADPQSR